MHEYRLCQLDELNDREPAYCQVNGLDLVVIRYDNNVSVLYGRCLHRGALMSDGYIDGQNLICGLHGWDYRYDTGVSEYNNDEVLHKFSTEIRNKSVWVDDGEINAYLNEHPQPFRQEEYLGLYADTHPEDTEPYTGYIKELAQNGLKKHGRHGPSAAMGLDRNTLPKWEDIQFLPAQLATRPLMDDAEVHTRVVIGPASKKPVALAIPVFVSDMSFGALSREAKIALSMGAELAGTGICSGEGGILPEELSGLQPMLTFRGLAVHEFQGSDCPAAMREIGRLRERIFRKSGAGRGGELDLDDLDFGPHAYTQLIAFDPAEEEIVATYRYQWGSRAAEGGDQVLRTSNLFDYSDDFRRNRLPYAMELGRSVVNDKAKRQRFGLFAIWKGLSALLNRHPALRYFFGNVTLYKSMDAGARDLLVAWLETHYPPPGPMLQAKPDVHYRPGSGQPAAVREAVDAGIPDTPSNRIKTLRSLLAEFEESVPPILLSYLAAGTDIWFGETVVDQDFGNALEIGIVIPASNIDRDFRSRFE